MKKLLLLVMLTPTLLQAQWHVNLFGGFSNYSGDLQSQFLTTAESYAAFGLGLQYDLTNHLSVTMGGNYGHVGASDKYNKPSLQSRNLSFETNIVELNLMAEYNILDITKTRFTPYGFVGIAVYHFNPYAYDTTGQKVFLKPLSTEGEGLPQYTASKPYALTQFAIPFGGGIKFRINDQITIAYELGLRKLFTDYLDDVSTSYVDKTILLNAKGPLAVEMAYRSEELKGGAPYPAAGAKRGSPKSKDWYYFSGIRLSIAFNSIKLNSQKVKMGIIDCPKRLN